MDSNSGTKLSHKQYKALLKKQKRQKRRQATARLQELEVKALPQEAIAAEVASRQDEQEEERQRQDEEERKRAHDAWLERERLAQEDFEVKRKKEESKKQKFREEQQRIQEEWEARQQIEDQSVNKKEKELEDILQQLDKEITQEADKPTHNPEAPRGQAQPAKRDVCPFYLKTGGCRFGDRCSRDHPQPESSTTLLLPHMYVDFTMEQSHRDEYDTDMSLEYDEGDAYLRFLEFYEDVLPEFKEIGTLVQFKVCCNWEPHLRGNVYVQFKREEDSSRAREMFHGRFYAGKQLSCVYTPVASWKAAICGMFHQNKCSRGKNCNFLHVFINPRHEFADADRDFKTTNHWRDQSQRGWRFGNDRSERGQRSRSTERERYRDHHRRSRSPTWDKRRSTDRRRSRERDRQGSLRSRRSRSRDRSRANKSRSRSRSQSRSPSKSRRHKSRSRSPTKSKRNRSRSRSRSHSRSPTKSRRHRSRSQSRSQSRSPFKSKRNRSRSRNRSQSRSPTKSKRNRSRSRSWSQRKFSRSPSPSRYHRSSRSRHRKSRSRSRSRSPGFDRSSVYGTSIKCKSQGHQESSSDTDEISKSRSKKKPSKKSKKRKRSNTKEEATIKLEHIEEINRESDNTHSPAREASRPDKTVEQFAAKKEDDFERTPVSSRVTAAKIETFVDSLSCVAITTGDAHPTVVRGESVSRHCSDGESEDTSESFEEKKPRSTSLERQIETRPKSRKKKRKHKKQKHKKDKSSPTHTMER